MTRSKTTAALVGSIAVLISAPALAAPGPGFQEKSMEVSIHGLDLSGAVDASILLERMQVAASRVCRLVGAPRTPQEQRVLKECATDAIKQAVLSLDEPTVTAVLYAQRTE